MRPYEGITIANFQDWVERGWTRKVDSPSDEVRELAVMALGLCGEAGEVVEHIKKELRGDGPANQHEICKELGDVLHYLCRIATEYNLSLDEIMLTNIEKIEARRGTRKWETA
jgi:NTP pyrophosphatase (non-canonical NTP hydrolase)